ncbi:MAG: hypothetical protein K2X52_13250 [Mycobacteriaceae bacterium]|nr:hypothetical protein [Mycobacteriaceae bacterium]
MLHGRCERRVSDAEIAEEQWVIGLFDEHREDLQFGFRYLPGEEQILVSR